METKVNLNEYERIDNLMKSNLKIIQNTRGFRFSLDAVLLANFATVRSGDTVLDLGTGSGVVPLLLSRISNAKYIYGLEIQPEVADMAKRSVILNGLSTKIKIIQGDLREGNRLLENKRFSLVVANPPYTLAGGGIINPGDSKAISRHEITCTLEDVISAGSRLVNSRGRVALVHRSSRLVEILILMRCYNLEPKRLRFVYPRLGRKSNLILIEAIKDGKPELEVLEPLYIYRNCTGEEYSPEMRKIYTNAGAGEQS